MRIVLALVGAAAIVGPTHFGSEAFPFDQWRQSWNTATVQTASLLNDISLPGNSATQDTFRETSLPASEFAPEPEADARPDTADAETAGAEAGNTEDTNLSALPEPEGTPVAPEDVALDKVCHTLASVAQVNGLPTGFFARLIWQESRFNPRIVSRAGAQGVAQFMPKVAAYRGLKNPFDPLEALPHSAQFLKEHVEYFGNLGLAAAAYNAGTRRVTDWLARRGKLPEETRNYVRIITGHEPEKWIQTSRIDLPVDLPNRAPCEGVADLSRSADPARIEVKLEPQIARIIADARAAAAKAARKRSKLLAKAKGGKDKKQAVAHRKPASGQARVRLADRR